MIYARILVEVLAKLDENLEAEMSYLRTLRRFFCARLNCWWTASALKPPASDPLILWDALFAAAAFAGATRLANLAAFGWSIVL